MCYFLSEKYIYEGECVSITYYAPLTIWDRALFISTCIIGLFASVRFTKAQWGSIVLLSVIYILVCMTFCLYGNNILEMNTEYWPHEYHSKPISDTLLFLPSSVIDSNKMDAGYIFIWVIIPLAIYYLYDKLRDKEGKKEVKKFIKGLFTTKDGLKLILAIITFLIFTSIPLLLDWALG